MINVRISFLVHGKDETFVISAVETGPVFPMNAPAQQLDSVKSICLGFMALVLLDLPQAVAKALPSLPEKIEGQAHYLNVARQWLNLVENGKEGARCIAHETPKGERQIIITLEPRKPNGT